MSLVGGAATPASPHRILIVRLSAIGDNVMTTPLIPCLRKSYPHAQIYWLCEARSAPLLQAHPELQEVIIWPKADWLALWRGRRWLATLAAVWRFRQRLASYHFDLVLDAQGLLKSGVLTWFTGAPKRVGLGSKEGSAWLMTRVVPRRDDHPLIGGEYHDLALAIGLSVEPFALQLHVPAQANHKARVTIERFGLGEGFVALVPFTTRPQKHWLAARWPLLCREIWHQFHLPCAILGGPNDSVIAGQIEAALETGIAVINLTGSMALSLIDAAALIRRARAVVGVDTGMTHMGSALQRPTVALFGSTVPYTEPLARRTRVLFEPMACAPCNKHPTCKGAYTCMRQLRVDQVTDALREALATADEERRESTAH